MQIPGTPSILPKMETSTQLYMQDETSLYIARMDRDVIKLWLSKLHLAWMKHSAAKLRLNAQVRKEIEHAKSLCEKTLLYTDANATSP